MGTSDVVEERQVISFSFIVGVETRVSKCRNQG